MNVKQPLFDEVLQKGIEVLGLSNSVYDFHKSKFKNYCILYCGRLLFSAYQTTSDQHKKPISLLTYAYAAGTFCRFLVDFTEQENPANTILSIITRNPFHNDEKLTGILLSSECNVLHEQYYRCRNTTVDETLRMCRTKEISLKMDGRLDEVMSILYALFLLGAHSQAIAAFRK